MSKEWETETQVVSTTQFDKRRKKKHRVATSFTEIVFSAWMFTQREKKMAQHYPNLSEYLLIFNNEIKESMTSLFCSTSMSDVPIRRIQSSDKYFRMQHMIHESIKQWIYLRLKSRRRRRKRRKILPTLQENICFVLTTLSSDRVIDKIQWSSQRNNNWLGGVKGNKLMVKSKRW